MIRVTHVTHVKGFQTLGIESEDMASPSTIPGIQGMHTPVRQLLFLPWVYGNGTVSQSQAHRRQGSHLVAVNLGRFNANLRSPYSQVPPQFDQYGRRKYEQPYKAGARTDAFASAIQMAQNPYGAPEGYTPPSRDPGYGRERQPAAPVADNRDARRRRLH